MKEIMICKSVSSFTLRGNSNGLQETLNDFSTKVTLAATFSLSGIFRVIVRQKTLLLMVLPGLLFRSSTAASVQIELAQFSAGAGARFTGSELSYAGFDVAIVGDHNGDGFTDYIFGASGQAMAVIVMKKNTVNTDMSLSSIVSGQYFRVIKAPTGSNFGSVLGGIGDINGDSFDDVIIGAATGAVPSRSTAGYAFVIFGMQGPFTDLVLTNDWVASSLGFMISGPASQSRFAGTFRTARGLGDVNGDGIGDFAVAATRYSGTTSRTQAGVVWVVFGQNTSVYSNVDTLLVPDNFGSSGVHYTGESDFGRLGQSIATAGDFNGDGITDFLMGAPNLTPNAPGAARTGAGAAYLIHGSKTALASTDLSTFVTGSMGVRFVGAWGGDNLGNALSGVGDINGDGMDDIALGAVYAVPLSRNLGGILYVIFGTRDAFTADVDLQAFTVSSQGFAVYGSAAGMSLGTVAPAGDVDGDGVNDIFVGGVQRNSLTHIVYGQREVRTANVDTLTDDVTTFSLDGGGHLGYALAGGEDLNGDGIVDILLGAHSANVEPTGGGSTLSEAGIVFMVPGPFVLPSKAPVVSPTMPPVATPTMEPTLPPTLPPTETPSQTPSETPSAVPSVQPSAVPSASPSAAPSTDPSLAPSAAPQVSPTVTPSAYPTQAPSATPSAGPTVHPTALPSAEPSLAPSVSPTLTPSVEPSVNPTVHPTCVPTVVPSAVPTLVPSANPTVFADRDFKLTVDVEQVFHTTLFSSRHGDINK